MALFEKYGVFNLRELESRYEINLEDYHKRIDIEARIAYDMAKSTVLPQVLAAYSKALKTNEMAINQGFPAIDGIAKELGFGLQNLNTALEQMSEAIVGKHEDKLNAMIDLRKVVDKLETVVSDEMWPLPKYREMLFIY